MKKLSTTTVGAVAILALASCGGVTPDDTYNSVEDLRDAVNSEDFRCTGGEPATVDSGYAEEISCDEGTLLIVWEEDAPEYVDGPARAGLGFTLLGGNHVLSTDTWLIRSDNAGLIEEMAPVFGGEYYGSDEDLLCEYNPNSEC